MNRNIYVTLSVIIMIFAVIITAGIALREKGWFKTSAIGFGIKAAMDEKAEMTWITGPIVVNLPGGSEESVSRVNIKIETDNAKVYDELEVLRPKIRDGITDIVSSKSYADISGEGNKQAIAKEIENMANAFLKAGKIRRVAFREYYYVSQP
jgi:flagellar basal body-associated protein FliL